ncbi:DUF4292 domain-containing protein [Aquimarina sp. W85]|uniref:DUF4292 domain-containing protein n=1 Tax=Aquimarina rhodophyticola TaxID=3342246 RepID=UPI00366FFEDF
MIRFLSFLCIVLIITSSCKSTAGMDGGTVKRLKSKKVIDNHYNSTFNFNTLNARVKINYKDDKQSVSPNVTLRMERDKKIWLSAKILGITLAKALITPNRVQYYEKINGTYFDGNFKMLSKWLGTELDYDKVQQLLLGQSLFDLSKDTYEVTVVDQGYQLKPKKELALFNRLFLIAPENFKMKLQLLAQPLEKRSLSVLYNTYQTVGGQDFPKEIVIKASQDQEQTLIKLDYRSVDYNANVSFPFSIPTGYEEVTVE